MRLSDLVSQLQVALDSKTNRKWDPPTLVEQLNIQHRRVVRKIAEVDEAYVNYTFTLSASKARTPHQGILAWRLPSWILKISSVRRSYGGATTTRGPLLPRATKWQTVGWRHGAANEIQLVGYGVAVDLELEVAKAPARMTSGTLPNQAGVTTSQLRMDADATAVYPHETQLDAYAGALFEITGPVPGAGTRVGQRLRCIGSDQDVTGRLLTMEEAWTSAPVTGDTYEMCMELPSQHSRLVVLLSARGLLAAERNMQGIAALDPEVNEEWRLFMDSIQYRDLAEPHTVVESIPMLSNQEGTTYTGEYQ